MHINWKKNIIYVIDTLLAVYIIIAITAWNIPKRNNYKCNKIDINISDSNNAGFLSVKEIKNILNRKKLYPLDKTINTINVRKIEETIKNEAFVKTCLLYTSPSPRDS